MSKNKHLTDTERLMIEHALREGKPIWRIAASLDKSASTISREIRARTTESNKYAAYRVKNRCAKRTTCQRYQLCADKPNCTKKCSTCSFCNDVCEEYHEEICLRLYDPPYCCNGCFEERQCVLRKKYYLHTKAHEAYREMLVEARVGANITEGGLSALDELVSPLIKRGQSVHHIAVHNADSLEVSEKTIYRYVNGGLLKARNIDMPRVVRMKPRKSKPVQHKIDSKCRIGRTFADFNSRVVASGGTYVEMDTVIGRPGGKVLLTLFFKSCGLMLAFIRERNTSQSVIDTFDSLQSRLGDAAFKSMFPAIITDNGSEFSNPKMLEFDAESHARTKIYYCDPYASFQKPNVELTHEFIRKLLPKGSSFDKLDQGHIDLMMSHINSYSREKLNDKSPLDLFCFIYGADIPVKLGLRKIPSNEIMLKPSLLK